MTRSSESFSESVLAEPFWSMKTEEVFRVLSSSPEGLAEAEAEKRRKILGSNEIRDHGGVSRLGILWNQFQSPLIFILIAAGLATLAFREWVEAAVIFAAVAVNAALGFWQENKAESVLELLKSYIRTRVRVRRGAAEREVDAVLLVPGDLVRLSQGDRVPADARVIFANALETDEAVLTGESLPEAKSPETLPAATPLADRSSMLFGGTTVTAGYGEAVITATGRRTEFGKIAALVTESERTPTPLQQSIAGFARAMGLVVIAAVGLIFAAGIAAGKPVFSMFLISAAIAVSAVPEGLPIALTVILAVGVERLARRKGVVRRLLAAETLGGTTLILTDKTGTLTQARMELAAVLPYPEERDGEEKKRALVVKALAMADAVLENPEAPVSEWKLSGRPLEIALVKGGAKIGLYFKEVRENIKIIDRLPFSSEYKYSAAVLERGGHKETLLFGAPEIILEFADAPDAEKRKIREEIEKRALAGERVLGLAAKDGSTELRPKEGSAKSKFFGFSFLGLFSFRDPLRPGVKEAMRRVAEAGVKTVMVTGDHRGTAEAVARELGMIDGKGAVLTGDDLAYLSEEALRERAKDVAVFARVTPEHKVRLVELYKKRGEVVAVTGDGVNDAPALKLADIGVAVGSGTDVSRDAADLVLADDNFETLVAAVEEGRKITGNIRKVIVYLLSNAFDELFLIGGALALGLALPLNALQILFVNFFSDSFPAIAFAFEEGVDGLGKKPRRVSAHIFDRPMKMLIFVIGVTTSAFLFAVYLLMLARGFDPELTRTFIFASFASYALFAAFSLRSLEKSIFSYNPLANRYLTAGVGIGLLLTVAAIYLPFLQNILDTRPLSLPWLLGVAGVGIANILAIELGKFILRK